MAHVISHFSSSSGSYILIYLVVRLNRGKNTPWLLFEDQLTGIEQSRSITRIDLYLYTFCLQIFVGILP